MTTLYRVAPYDHDAAAGEPGHPLFVPPDQRNGRIDNPDWYTARYFAEDPIAAIAEAFASRTSWRSEMFLSKRAPNARRALLRFDVDARVIDLDDPAMMLRRRLRGSDVATPVRKRSQAWALRIFEDGGFDGIRWWSVRDARWGVLGLWITPLDVTEVEPLSPAHPLVAEAAERLGRPLAG